MNSFKYLRNIETSFQMIRLVAIVVIITCISFAGYMAYSAFKTVENSRQRVYVLENGKSLMLALSQDQNVNRSAEAKSHLKMFHELFFSQEPNEKQIIQRMGQAARLGDNSVIRLYRDLQERNFFSQLISGNVVEKFELDSVGVDFTKSPYHAVVKGKQTFVRESTISIRELVTDCYLVNAQRTDENPHGFTIERLRVIRNPEIKRLNRTDQGNFR